MLAESIKENMMKFLISVMVVAGCFIGTNTMANTNLTNDVQARNFVTKQLNKELASVDKRHKVFKIQKILSEYDASQRIYFMEVDFKWKDHKGKTHNCSGQVQTQGYNSNRHAVDIPYVCYRVAGLG